MTVSFQTETWKFVEAQIDNLIKNKTVICTNDKSSYKDMLLAQGAIAALKTIKDLPNAALRAAQARINTNG